MVVTSTDFPNEAEMLSPTASINAFFPAYFPMMSRRPYREINRHDTAPMVAAADATNTPASVPHIAPTTMHRRIPLKTGRSWRAVATIIDSTTPPAPAVAAHPTSQSASSVMLAVPVRAWNTLRIAYVPPCSMTNAAMKLPATAPAATRRERHATMTMAWSLMGGMLAIGSCRGVCALDDASLLRLPRWWDLLHGICMFRAPSRAPSLAPPLEGPNGPFCAPWKSSNAWQKMEMAPARPRRAADVDGGAATGFRRCCTKAGEKA
mmetsp:Transcript_51383/g.122313  ORF Transcript_51383/g.122313 Transcript_51383/m.122313 type:complete len:264 (+) Transcript_51383:571-1362(+)